MRAIGLAGLLAAGLLTVGPNARAATINFTETLTGSQETPPNTSTATGTGTEMLDTTTDLFTWTVMWSGLSAPFTAAHFHMAPPGVPGPVQVDLSAIGTLTLGGGGTSGSSTGSTTLTSTQVADVLAGLWYVNVHTSAFPAGEIRGQLTATPEPATTALLGAGLALIGLRAARRRQRA